MKIMTVKPVTISVKRDLGYSLRYIDIRILVVRSKNVCVTFCVTLVHVEVQYECECGLQG